MKRRIQVLPDDVIDRIAAGEVVERPASVVKELVENAIDAGATQVSILVEEGGVRAIRVVDNGTGMTREDARLAFQRHATSKIQSSSDLSKIQTLGFRGEALPSIASVSRILMTTKTDQSLAGTEIVLAANRIEGIRDIGCRKGTDVTVRDLFFNTPARRKFQRSVGTELSHIVETVTRVALARCEIHFKLFHNDKLILAAPSTEDRLTRIGSLLGKETYQALHRADGALDSLHIEGYLSDPTYTRPNSRGIYTYVNGRFVKDRIIHHAIMAGYRDRIPKDRYPVAILFLHLPLWSVDPNVHPAKSEVRFSSTQLIHRGVAGLFADVKSGPTEVGSEFAVAQGASIFPSPSLHEPVSTYAAGGAGTSREVESEAPRRELFQRASSSFRVLGQIARTYLICESRGGLILIDQHAAHERVVFQRLKRALGQKEPEVQTLLFPETLELSPGEWEAAEQYLPELRRLGFDLECFGRHTVAIKSVPSIFPKEDCRQTILDMIRDLRAEEGRGAAGKPMERVLKVAACHGAIRSGKALSTQEMLALLADMEKEGFSQTCPHGRPACVEIGSSQLEKMFMRSS